MRLCEIGIGLLIILFFIRAVPVIAEMILYAFLEQRIWGSYEEINRLIWYAGIIIALILIFI